MLSHKKDVMEIIDNVGVEQSFVEFVIQAANGDFSTDDTNIDCIYEVMYGPVDVQNK